MLAVGESFRRQVAVRALGPALQLFQNLVEQHQPPGLDRLQRALALTEHCSHAPEDFLRWMNDLRPEKAPELTETRLTVENVAAETEELFRQRAVWWGG